MCHFLQNFIYVCSVCVYVCRHAPTHNHEKEALEKEAALKFREAWGDHMPPPAHVCMYAYTYQHIHNQEKEALEKEAALKFREAWGDHMPPPAPKIEEAFAEAVGGKSK
jgi:hypothetical protein